MNMGIRTIDFQLIIVEPAKGRDVNKVKGHKVKGKVKATAKGSEIKTTV